jgi:uncharacterized membrane protein SpoIIM required for sporulation
VKQRAFESTHRTRWRDFSTLLERAESVRGRYRLEQASHAARAAGATGAESAERADSAVQATIDRRPAADRFITSYRALCRDLSIAKARGYSPSLIDYLNDLVIRGHNVVYARRSGFVERARAFLVAGFPRLVRAEARYVGLAAFALLGPALMMGAAIVARPEFIYSIMSVEQVTALEAMYDPAADRFGRERAPESDFLMFGYYVWNNVSLGFRAFATGLLIGLGSLLVLGFNGVYLGAVSVHLLELGFGSTFLPFVIGHAALELSALVLCGAAGLKLGHALLAPAQLPRRQALVIAARIGVRVLIGATAMMMAAAFIEAFWSAMQWPGATLKFLVGGALWCAVICYFIFPGRSRGPDTA